MDKYLNGSGSGYSWDTGWKGEWNSGTSSTTTTSTTTTTIPVDTTTTTTTTTLPPSNTTTTTLPCTPLSEAMSSWRQSRETARIAQRGNLTYSGYYIIDSGGDRDAIVNGTPTTVRYVSEEGTFALGDTYLGGENGIGGLLLWTHTLIEITESGSGRFEYTPVYPDSVVEQNVRDDYSDEFLTPGQSLCP
jgi:hypothetical protein